MIVVLLLLWNTYTLSFLNLDNLYSIKGADEHFKIFIGFKNSVCTNLCVWSDDYMGDLKVTSYGGLKTAVRIMLENYNGNFHLQQMKKLSKMSITEQQFAHLIGRCMDANGNINLWKLYNLFIGANKSSYIDNFLNCNVNAYHFVEKLRFVLKNGNSNWFLN